MLGSIEAGGTKFVCAVGDKNLNVVDRISFSTTTPEETMKKVFEFFNAYKDLKAIGIGSFGPIDINKNSPRYGYITSTPKLEWKDFNFLGAVKKHYHIPIGWTTDVNAACLGEYEVGSAVKNDSCIYLTIGTGIGGGAIVKGKFIEGFGHPEMGHILVRRHPKDDNFQGWCPYHGDCLEGLAAGPSVEKRYGMKAQDLGPDHEVWEILAYYLAQALFNYTLVLRPEKIILGGGVMKQPQLLEMIKKEFMALLGDYIEISEIDEYIVKPILGDNAGIIGGLILAKEACK
ncbi:ROK family protein [Tissierella sp. Yu-01]|uniref:ROK family protein n=1 Tax=Tissierella sp. Yu-01 TaxID=3035694 RepID=UPI00240E4907|nr:ROK family protein [Tissierella sp. Yu-01]WFA08089.1 ROK family protein [Tissierella sp. Yu-01]